MKIFLSVGEPSGDLHGANLAKHLKELVPGIRIGGFGGPKMREAGVEQIYPLAEHAAIGFINVALQYRFYVARVNEAADWMDREKPDAIVLVDFPGMNWHVARRAADRGIPVYYFVPPQLWAWAGWRVKKMKRWVNEAFTNFPFEDKWYQERGMPTTLVGHPYFDEMAEEKLDPATLSAITSKGGTIIGMLPGSRGQELANNVPAMLETAEILFEKHPEVRFHFACYKAKQAEWVRAKIAGNPKWARLPVEVHFGKTPEVIEASRFMIAVSGSVSLELLWRTKPCVTVYHGLWIYLQLARIMMTCKYISLVNLLADEEVFPEFKHHRSQGKNMAKVCLDWLAHPEKVDAIREKLVQLRSQWAIPGASARAAKLLVERIAARSGGTGG